MNKTTKTSKLTNHQMQFLAGLVVEMGMMDFRETAKDASKLVKKMMKTSGATFAHVEMFNALPAQARAAAAQLRDYTVAVAGIEWANVVKF